MNMKKLVLLAGLTALYGMAPALAFSQDESNNFLMPAPLQSDNPSTDQSDASIYTGPALDFNFYGQEEETPGVVNQYSNKYKKKFAPSGSQDLLPAFSYTFQFLQGNDINNAVLRFIAPAALTGCAAVVQSPMVIEENPPYLTVKLQSKPSVKPDKEVRYAPYHCDKSRKYAQIDLPLNHTALVEKGINKIILNGGSGRSRMLDVNTEGSRIEVVSGNEIAVFPAE